MKDSSGNTYFVVDNIRITCVPKTWRGDSGLRIQAYKKDGILDKSLNQGAEIPVSNKDTAFDLLSAISMALKENGL